MSITDDKDTADSGFVPVVLEKNEQDYGDVTTTRQDGAITSSPHGCCRRFSQEWRYPGMFGIEEGGGCLLDIPATFGPTDIKSRLFKVITWGFAISTTFITWYERRAYPGFYLAYLTYWTGLFTCVYTTCSLLQSSNLPLLRPRQPAKSTDSISMLSKATWIWFEIAAVFNLIVTVLYWTLEYEYDGSMEPKYSSVMAHGGVFFLVWIEGLVVNRTPVRMKHVWVPTLIAFCYVMWTVIHGLATDIGNPFEEDNDPDTTDDLIYSVIDWEGSTVATLILCLAVVFVAIPVVFLFMWLISLSSFPCRCNGSSRRYIGGRKQQASENEEATKSTVNVNVYETA